MALAMSRQWHVVVHPKTRGSICHEGVTKPRQSINVHSAQMFQALRAHISGAGNIGAGCLCLSAACAHARTPPMKPAVTHVRRALSKHTQHACHGHDIQSRCQVSLISVHIATMAWCCSPQNGFCNSHRQFATMLTRRPSGTPPGCATIATCYQCDSQPFNRLKHSKAAGQPAINPASHSASLPPKSQPSRKCPTNLLPLGNQRRTSHWKGSTREQPADKPAARPTDKPIMISMTSDEQIPCSRITRETTPVAFARAACNLPAIQPTNQAASQHLNHKLPAIAL